MTTTRATIRDQVIDIAAEAVTRIRFATVPANVRIAVRRSDRDAVCIWIGEMQAYNGGITIEEIVRLARMGECERRNVSTPPHEHGEACPAFAFITALVREGIAKDALRSVTGQRCNAPVADIGGALTPAECPNTRPCSHHDRVPSWFDDHASFVVPSRVHPNGIRDTRFTVPPLTLSHATEAER